MEWSSRSGSTRVGSTPSCKSGSRETSCPSCRLAGRCLFTQLDFVPCAWSSFCICKVSVWLSSLSDTTCRSSGHIGFALSVVSSAEHVCGNWYCKLSYVKCYLFWPWISSCRCQRWFMCFFMVLLNHSSTGMWSYLRRVLETGNGNWSFARSSLLKKARFAWSFRCLFNSFTAGHTPSIHKM